MWANHKNYKEYSEIYSTIEIEIIPSFIYEKPFIQIYDKDFQVREGIHIYFDGNKEELIEKNCLYYDDNVNRIKIIIDYKIKSFENLFYGCNGAKEISFLFSDCQSLEKIIFSNFNTNNVADMSFTFYRCSMIKELNLSCFNTKNVTNM